MTEDDIPDAVRASLRQAPTLAAVCDIVKRSARVLAGASGATFVLAEGDQCFYVDEDAIAPLWRGQRFPTSTCISGWAMIHEEQVAVPDIVVDERIPQVAYAPTFVRALLMTPVGAPPRAAIGVYWARTYRPTPEQEGTLRALAAETAAALERVGLDEAPEQPWSFVRAT